MKISFSLIFRIAEKPERPNFHQPRYFRFRYLPSVFQRRRLSTPPLMFLYFQEQILKVAVNSLPGQL